MVERNSVFALKEFLRDLPITDGIGVLFPNSNSHLRVMQDGRYCTFTWDAQRGILVPNQTLLRIDDRTGIGHFTLRRDGPQLLFSLASREPFTLGAKLMKQL